MAILLTNSKGAVHLFVKNSSHVSLLAECVKHVPEIGHAYSISMKALKYHCNNSLSDKLFPRFFML